MNCIETATPQMSGNFDADKALADDVTRLIDEFDHFEVDRIMTVHTIALTE